MKITKKIVSIFLVSLFSVMAYGATQTSTEKPKKMIKIFQTVPMSDAVIAQEGVTKAFCPECGMTLSMFFKTNHLAHVAGKTKQYCSLHCVVGDLKKGHTLDNIQVVDTNRLGFIDAKKAYYVVGSRKKGTMSKVSKYAFLLKSEAEAFAKENGGKVTDFNGALAAAQKEFENDAKMIAKKQKMMAKKGQMLYTNKCQKAEKTFLSTASAKAYVVEHNLCQGLNGKQLQAVGLYLTHKK